MNGILFGSRVTNRATNTAPALRAMTALALCAVGCNGPQRQNGVVQSVPESAREDLRIELQEFLDFAQASVDRAAMEIGRKSVSRDHQRSALLWRTNVVARAKSVARNEDAREGLLDVWAFSQRLVNFFESGDGKFMFGEHQPIALASAKKVLAAAEHLAVRFVPEDLYTKAKEQVIAFAVEKPLTGTFSEQTTDQLSDEAASEGIIAKIVGMPFAPLTALKGVGEAPKSISDIGHAVDRFTEAVKSIPGDARWELQLLAMSLEELPSILESVASMKRISQGVSHGSQALDDLPRKLREESELLLARADESQLELRTTLGETQRTIEKFRDMTAEADRTVSSVREASVALENAANAVTVTATEVLKFIPASLKDETGQLIGGPPKKNERFGPFDRPESAGLESGQESSVQDATPAEDTSFSFQAVTKSAEALGDTVGRLQLLLVDLRGILDSDVVPEKIGALDVQFGQSLEATSLRIEGIVDHVATRAAQLIALAFALLIVYGWLRLKARPARG